MNTAISDWLTEDTNPAVKFRVETEILGLTADKSAAREWIFSRLPKDWYDTKGLWYIYYLTALAESGMTKDDIPAEHTERALKHLADGFDCSCSDFMLMRALVMLGFSETEEFKNACDTLESAALPDGGFVCRRIINKLSYTPKSCYKADLHALMFLSECGKMGISPSCGRRLVDYFFNRNIFYKSDKTTLIFGGEKGGRTIDVFHPFEPMRVGLHNVVEALSALGYGNDERLSEAWMLMDENKDENGMLILSGTLTKSYLPKERVGKPGKWATFYMLLAEKERSI